MDWRGFELHPEVPPGGVPITALFPPEDLALLGDHLRRFAAGFGLPPLRLPGHLPSTRGALAVTEYARQQGRLWALEEALMQGYWRGGLALEDPDQLARIAGAVGLDPAAARAAMTDPATLRRVDALRQEATEQGVRGIPTWVFGDGPQVVGCEPYPVLERAALQAGARPRGPTGERPA